MHGGIVLLDDKFYVIAYPILKPRDDIYIYKSFGTVKF